MKTIQEKFTNENEAVQRAGELFKEKDCDYACVIQDLKTGIFYVENEPGLIRNFEKLIKEYSIKNI